MSIQIIIADDQNLVRMGICSLLKLRDDIDIVAELDDGSQVLSALQQYKSALLLLDIRMPKMNGLQVLQAMQTRGLTTPTLVLTTFDEHDLMLECARFGAKGYLRKDVRLADLHQAVDALISGETWFQPGITVSLVKNGDFSKQTVMLPEPLSKGEVQVLRLAASGYNNAEIAQALFKSDGTIRNLMSTSLAKLQVRDRTRAVLKAIELGLI
ncbi:MAG: response regulator transcription factor [Alteromonadaceae bacterium]|nr:response regulator transcription factor [Alteromonadaceae bacterium]